MASKLVVLRQRLAKAIHSALERFAEVVTPALNERFEPFLVEGEAPVDFSELQQLLRRMAEASFESMVAADKAHLDELTNDIAPRIERDRWVETVLSRLKSPDFRPPEASTASIVFDPVALANELEPMVSALRSSIDAVELERRAAATSQQEKREAMTEHDLLIAASGRILSGFYLLARRPDLADRVRLSLPRKPGPPNGDDSSNDDDSSNGNEPSEPTDTEPAANGSGPVPAQ